MHKVRIGTHEGIEVSFIQGDNFNGHIGIYGLSGVGKSHLLQIIAMRIAEKGETVALLDTNGSHTQDQMNPQMRRSLQKVHEVDGSEGIPLPTEYIKDDGKALAKNLADSVEQAGVAQRDALIYAIEYCCKEGTILTQGIKATAEALELDGSMPAKRILDKLDEVIESNAFRIGDGFVKEGALNIIHISELTEDVQRISTGVILGYIWDNAQKGKFKDKPITICLDEIHSLRKGPVKILGDLLSEGRKFGVNIVFATQSLGDFKGSILSHRISQAAVRFIFCPTDDEVEIFAKSIAGGDRGKLTRILKTLKLGECIATGRIYLGEEVKRKPIKILVDSGEEVIPYIEPEEGNIVAEGNTKRTPVRGIVRKPVVNQNGSHMNNEVIKDFIMEGAESDGSKETGRT